MLWRFSSSSLTFLVVFLLVGQVLWCVAATTIATTKDFKTVKNDCFFCSLCGCGALNFPHYTVERGKGLFFGLGCFPVVDCVWGEGLFHTAMFDFMLSCVDVGVVAC